eukprot:TRINITY_DN1701_c0_g1_i1.p1 TRINITY_DN1701_c0_g1~~TRINITY_DN1701_c0_g1_i1.p1  ORF type:complete len:219 (-),score=39.84 TRINITY_DN1701_c0_g1_i1:143-799(-)
MVIVVFLKCLLVVLMAADSIIVENNAEGEKTPEVFKGTFPLVSPSSNGAVPAFLHGSNFSDAVSRIESFQVCWLDDCAGRHVIEGAEGDTPGVRCRFADGRSAPCWCDAFTAKGLYICEGKAPTENQQTDLIDTPCSRIGECSTALEQKSILLANIVNNDTAALHAAVEQIAGVMRWKGNDTLVLMSGFAAQEGASLLKESIEAKLVGVDDVLKGLFR